MHSKSAQKLYCIKMKWKVTEERFIVYVAILCFVFIINVSAVFCLFVLFFKFVAIPKVLLDGLTCTHSWWGSVVHKHTSPGKTFAAHVGMEIPQ